MRTIRRLSPRTVILAALLIVMSVGIHGVATAAKPWFVDNGNGTITDNQTGLMWEKKTDGNVNDLYTWSSTGTAADGTLFTSFLATMNCEVSADASCPGSLAGHYDWRIPNIAELRTIVDLSAAGCGTGSPCIGPIFGPTAAAKYWSSTSRAGAFGPEVAWVVFFLNGGLGANFKVDVFSVRAVRGGS